MTHPILDRVSYHAVYDASMLDALEYAKENGFAGIQLAVELPHLSFESLSAEQVLEAAYFAESNGVYITIHAPDEAASLFEHSRFLRDGIMNYYRALFDFAGRVKARLVTVHIGAMTTFPTDTRREMSIREEDLAVYRGVVTRNLNTLVEMAAGRFAVCVENYALDEFSLFLLKPYLESHRLALCWDLAKSWNKPALERFLFSSMDRVKQVHLHDIRKDEGGNERSHRVIGTGEIDFSSYLNRLAEADVLDYCIEVRPREKAKESLQALRMILGVI
jgi:sugar phosphate isomerase/epimerase